MDVLDTCHVTSTFGAILICLVLKYFDLSKFGNMGKNTKKRRASTSRNKELAILNVEVGEYQSPVLELPKLMAVKHSKLDELSLRAVTVNNAKYRIFLCRELIDDRWT